MASNLNLAIDLIRRPSITPEDAGCQTVMIPWLDGDGGLRFVKPPVFSAFLMTNLESKIAQRIE